MPWIVQSYLTRRTWNAHLEHRRLFSHEAPRPDTKTHLENEEKKKTSRKKPFLLSSRGIGRHDGGRNARLVDRHSRADNQVSERIHLCTGTPKCETPNAQVPMEIASSQQGDGVIGGDLAAARRFRQRWRAGEN